MEDSAIQEILQRARVIAVVGLSPREDRPSYRVASYLKGCGYRIIPVNPAVQEVLGERAYGSLGEIPDSIEVDVVDVFRRPEDTPAIAEEAVARKARVLWLQEGIVSREAKDIASAAGLQVVMDRCMLKEHKRLVKPGA
jgi:predicted CoA-binding protein